MKIQPLWIINKKMRKLEKLYDKTPEKAIVRRLLIEKKMQKLETQKAKLKI